MYLDFKQLFFLVLILLGFTNCNPIKEKDKSQPNIVIIMSDDMGYSDLGCYGSEISTPNIDNLANEGIRFNEFYSSARCCPTRASLLTGLYPHNAGIGNMTLAPGKEGVKGPYQGYLSRNAVTIAEALKSAGYKSYLSGKWHVGEGIENWPLQRGFDRYFGLISGASSYFELIKGQKRRRQMALDNDPWEPPSEGFYMTDAITDHAIDWIKESKKKENPFFLYVAYTAPHWPLHALPEDIAKYEGKYDIGWDSIRKIRYNKLKKLGLIEKSTLLSERPENIPAWTDVENKEEWADKMEVYAAMIDRMDQGVGKIIEELKKQDQLENTLILFLSDNGASNENIEKRGLNNPSVSIGSRKSYAAYREPWANVSNTPYRYYKKSIYEGGIVSPFIAHWPNMIKNKGSIINQLGSVTDILPTLLDMAKIKYPKIYKEFNIKPTDGISLLPALVSNKHVDHGTIYWEHVGNKAVREGKWKLVANSWGEWELYDIDNDGSEINNLAEVYKDTLNVLINKYSTWAKEVGVEQKK